jgi:hypothetical protein
MATSSRPTRVRAKLTADNRESVAAARKPASGPSTNILPHALPLPITHNPAISEAPVPALGNKRSASQPASEVGDESSNEDEAPLKSKKKRQTNRTKKSDGM